MSRLVSREVYICDMHCKSCEKRVRDELKKIPGVRSAKVSLKTRSAIINSDVSLTDDVISDAVEKAGYRIDKKHGRPAILTNDDNVIKTAIISVATIAMAYFVLSRANINLSSLGPSSGQQHIPLVAIGTGLLAGFSTCMALIGGLVAGVSSRYASSHRDATITQKFVPHLFFNGGRIVGFAAFGGLMGLIGSALSFSPFILGIMTIVVGVFMMMIGLQLTELFPRLTAFSLPSTLAEKLGIDSYTKGYSGSKAAMLGILTFFLPCGFTQAMQLLAVSTGSWQLGAMTMGLFAIGTTPGLLMIGGLASVLKGAKAKIVFRFIGALVVALAVSSLATGVNLTAPNLAKISFGLSSSSSAVPSENHIELTYLGGTRLDKSTIKLRKDQSYTITIHAKVDGSGCMSTIMLPGLSNDSPQILSTSKDSTINVKAGKSGTYQLSCAMGLPFDSKVIVEG